MNLRHLADFFRDTVSAEMILKEITSEVREYQQRASKKGSSLPIYATEDDFHFVLERKDIKRICELYLNGTFDEWHIQYICNLIELASSFSAADDKVEDAVFQIANPEINFPITAETVRRIYNSL